MKRNATHTPIWIHNVSVSRMLMPFFQALGVWISPSAIDRKPIRLKAAIVTRITATHDYLLQDDAIHSGEPAKRFFYTLHSYSG